MKQRLSFFVRLNLLYFIDFVHISLTHDNVYIIFTLLSYIAFIMINDNAASWCKFILMCTWCYDDCHQNKSAEVINQLINEITINTRAKGGLSIMTKTQAIVTTTVIFI